MRPRPHQEGALTPAVEAAVGEIRSDTSRGASQLARAALLAISDAAGELRRECDNPYMFLVRMARQAWALAQCRPAMAPLANAPALFFDALAEFADRHEPPLDQLAQRAGQQARDQAEQSRDATDAIARHAADLLAQCRCVVSLSWSSTVLAALEALRAQGQFTLLVAESRPLLEGRELARRAAQAGIRTVIFPDAQVGTMCRQADAALCGADAVLPDGAVVNKAGTYLLALAARDNNVPLYALAERLKIRGVDGAAENAGHGAPKAERGPQEEGEPAAVWEDPPPGVEVGNLTFECTPGNLVGALVTEAGPLGPEQVRAIARTHGAAIEKLRRFAGGD